jgi:hypothetical protein
MTISDRTYVRFFISLLVLIVLSPFVGAVLKNFLGLPNIISVAKDAGFVLFFIVMLLGYGRRSVAQLIPLSLVAFSCFFFLYFYTAVIENHLKEGLYFLRLHMLPYLFVLACYYFFTRINKNQTIYIIRAIFILNVVSNVISIISYIVTTLNPMSLYLFFGYDKMQSSFIISGGNLLRLTLPQASPNTLGIYLSLNIALSIFVLGGNCFGNKEKIAVKFLCLFDLLLLILTFSRSSFILIIVTLAVMVFFRPSRYLLKTAKLFGFSLLFVIISAAIVDSISNNKLSDWVQLNMTFQDPSIEGHIDSYKRVFSDFGEYQLHGYEKGCVGPRAFLFRKGYIINPESSLMALLYEMGIYQLVFLLMSCILVLVHVIRDVKQIAILIGMATCLQFLPNVYETDIIAYFIVVLFLLSNFPRNQAAIESGNFARYPYLC